MDTHASTESQPPVPPETLSALSAPDAASRYQACQALHRYQELGPALPILLRMKTQDPDGSVRACTLYLASLRAGPNEIGDADYLTALRDPEPGVQDMAATVLSTRPEVPAEAVAGLIGVLKRQVEGAQARQAAVVQPPYMAAKTALEKAGTPEAMQAVSEAEGALSRLVTGHPVVPLESAGTPPLVQEVRRGEARIYHEVAVAAELIVAVLMVSASIRFYRRLTRRGG